MRKISIILLMVFCLTVIAEPITIERDELVKLKNEWTSNKIETRKEINSLEQELTNTYSALSLATNSIYFVERQNKKLRIENALLKIIACIFTAVSLHSIASK